MINCDNCYTKIQNNECACGYWFPKHDKHPILPVFQRIFKEYHELSLKHKKFIPVSAEHEKGYVCIVFKGDHRDCMKIRKFIENGFKA